MDVLPTDRNFVSFAAMTPAVLVTGVRQNVGGSIPETGMNLQVHGSRNLVALFGEFAADDPVNFSVRE